MVFDFEIDRYVISVRNAFALNSIHNLCFRDQQPPKGGSGGGDQMDLYHWIRQKICIAGDENALMSDGHLNPMEISPSVYFWPVHNWLDLQSLTGSSQTSSLLASMGQTNLAFSLQLFSFNLCVVEPKFLKALTAIGKKRIGHTNHHLLKVSGVNISGEFGYSQNSKTGCANNLKTSCGLLDVQYKVKVEKVKIGLGIPNASLMNQLGLIGKSVAETCKELDPNANKGRLQSTGSSFKTDRSSSVDSGFWSVRICDKLDDYERAELRRPTALEHWTLITKISGNS